MYEVFVVRYLYVNTLLHHRFTRARAHTYTLSVCSARYPLNLPIVLLPGSNLTIQQKQNIRINEYLNFSSSRLFLLLALAVKFVFVLLLPFIARCLLDGG